MDKKHPIHIFATETLIQYQKLRGGKLTFPLDAMDVMERLLGLETIFDEEGVLNAMDPQIIGCLFPDGCPSPWGKDKMIVVNKTATPDESNLGILGRNENFTIAHEGGHYIMQFLKGITGDKTFRTIYCRRMDKSFGEWQADFFAGELTQPPNQVQWLLDGKKPGEIINLELYGKNYRGYFGASQGMMETRLTNLGYRLINAKYPWANCV